MTVLDALQRYADRRDPDAFAFLVTQHQQMVYGVCLRRLGNEADACDAARDTFVKLAKSAGAVRGSLVGWLHRCATTSSIDLIRSESRRRSREAKAALPSAVAADARHDPQWAEVRAALDEALDELPEAQRDLIVQRYLVGRSGAELARELGVSDSLVSRRVRSAIDELRHRLSAKGFSLGLSVLATGLAAESAVAVRIPEGGQHRLKKGGAISGVSGRPGVSTWTASRVDELAGSLERRIELPVLNQRAV